jgi:chromosome partitioning protein
VARTDRRPSAADVLLDTVPIRQVIRPTSFPGLDLVTGSPALANVDAVLGGVKGREYRLQQALAPVHRDYDFVILDCPSSLSLLPLNALVACDGFIVPVAPQYLAVEGLANLLEAMARLKTVLGIAPVFLGIVLTLVDERSKATRDVIDRVRAQYGDLVFATQIHINTRLAEAPAFGQSIFAHDATAPGAEAYRRLTDEVLTQCHKVEPL